MFGDFTVYDEMAEKVLEDLTLDEVLEMNNLTDQEVLAYLIQEGLIKYPEL